MSDHSPPVQDSFIDSLISTEPHHAPNPNHILQSVNLVHRQDSINWILNAHSHFRFHPLTAILSVNYFDRFISSGFKSTSNNKTWEFQLLSVACLSLAAKMNELDIPLLMDLQVSKPRFVFEPKTIQRMELWVMEKLNWRLRSVTPFDYIHYFMLKLSHSFDKDHLHCICSDLIVKTTRVINFIEFQPSEIGAATVIIAAGKGVDQVPESYYEKVNKERVGSCHRLMDEYLVDTCPSASHNVRKQQCRDDEPPASPDGVLDAVSCVTCDTCSDDRLLNQVSGYEDGEVKQVRSIV